MTGSVVGRMHGPQRSKRNRCCMHEAVFAAKSRPKAKGRAIGDTQKAHRPPRATPNYKGSRTERKLFVRCLGCRHCAVGQQSVIDAVLAAMLMPGMTVIVSPLIALMRDQFHKLSALGLEAVSSAARLEIVLLIGAGQRIFARRPLAASSGFTSGVSGAIARSVRAPVAIPPPPAVPLVLRRAASITHPPSR